MAAIEENDEMAERERKAAELLRGLRARPKGKALSPDELRALISRMPAMPEDWTSADYIRELRGPLPEDDPELLLARLREITPVDLGNMTAADIIREDREERADQIIDAITDR